VTPELSNFCRAHSGVSLLFIHNTTPPSFFSLKSGALGFRLLVVLFHHRFGVSVTDFHLSSALLSWVCRHFHELSAVCFNTSAYGATHAASLIAFWTHSGKIMQLISSIAIILCQPIHQQTTDSGKTGTANDEYCIPQDLLHPHAAKRYQQYCIWIVL